MPDTTTLEPYRPYLNRLIQGTYDYHVRQAQPWGFDSSQSEGGSNGCLYAQNCAIGLQLPEDVARYADDFQAGGIDELLAHPYGARVRNELFGSEDTVPTAVATVLATIQSHHDHHAINEFVEEMDPDAERAEYGLDLKAVAQTWGLTLHQ